MGWVRDNVAVLTAAAGALLWIGGAVVHFYLVQADVYSDLSLATNHRDDIEKRVAVVEAAQQEQTVHLTRISTQQNGIVKSTDKMDKQIDRLHDKLDKLLRKQ